MVVMACGRWKSQKHAAIHEAVREKQVENETVAWWGCVSVSGVGSGLGGLGVVANASPPHHPHPSEGAGTSHRDARPGLAWQAGQLSMHGLPPTHTVAVAGWWRRPTRRRSRPPSSMLSPHHHPLLSPLSSFSKTNMQWLRMTYTLSINGKLVLFVASVTVTGGWPEAVSWEKCQPSHCACRSLPLPLSASLGMPLASHAALTVASPSPSLCTWKWTGICVCVCVCGLPIQGTAFYTPLPFSHTRHFGRGGRVYMAAPSSMPAWGRGP